LRLFCIFFGGKENTMDRLEMMVITEIVYLSLLLTEVSSPNFEDIYLVLP
jgi:hypothetical protein